MSDTIVERVARALDPGAFLMTGGDSADARDDARIMARRAVEAMRDVPDAIVTVGCKAVEKNRESLMAAHLSGNKHDLAQTKMRIRWRSMIDAILAR